MADSTGSAPETFTAFQMQQALDAQKAQFRASLATNLSVLALSAALISVGSSIWLFAGGGNSSHQAQVVPVAYAPQAAPQPAQAVAPAPAPVAAVHPPQAAPAQQQAAPVQTSRGGPVDASQIYLTAGSDGEMYAFDAMAGSWFRFEDSLPVEIPEAQVPPEARAEALRQHETGDNPLAPNTAAATQHAEAAIGALGRDDRYPLVNELLAVPEVAQQYLTAIARAAAIEVPGEAAGEHPVYVFYDPRCPYSQEAFKALDGLFEMRWLHTLALGGDGTDVTDFILGDMEVERSEDGEIVSAVMTDDAERHERLRQVMNGQQAPAGGEMSEAHNFTVDENSAMLRSLYGEQTALIGVPSFIVPRPDGTAVFLRGFDNQTVDIIRSAISGDE